MNRVLDLLSWIKARFGKVRFSKVNKPILDRCRFSARATPKFQWKKSHDESVNDIAKRLMDEEIARWKKAMPNAEIVTEEEAQNSGKTIVMIFTFSSHTKHDYYIYGTDVMMRCDKKRWMQIADSGNITFHTLKNSDPKIEYGYYYYSDGETEVDIVRNVQYKEQVYLEI